MFEAIDGEGPPRSATGRSWSPSIPPACARRRSSTSTSPTSTSTRSSSTARARAARSASCRSARRPRTGWRSTSAKCGRSWLAAPRTHSSSPSVATGSTRTLRRLLPTPIACRHASATHLLEGGAEPAQRSREPLGHSSLSTTQSVQRRRCEAPDRSTTHPTQIPRSKASSRCSRPGGRRRPSTWTSATCARSAMAGRAPLEEAHIRGSLALARRSASGRLSPATIARRVAAVRPLLPGHRSCPASVRSGRGARAPRRRRRLPRMLSAAEAQRLIEAAAGYHAMIAPRPRARSSPSTARASTGQRGGRARQDRGTTSSGGKLLVRLAPARAARSESSRSVRHAAEALRRYPGARARGTSTAGIPARAVLLNAQGGDLTRAGAFLILRSGRARGPRAGARPSAPVRGIRCDPSPRRRRRSAQCPGDARPTRT